MSRFPRRVSQRDVANALEGLNALANDVTPNFKVAPGKKLQAGDRRSATPESAVMDQIREWAKYKSMRLFRNNVGAFQWSPGKWLRYGLCTGSSDFIGYTAVTITASMVGKKVAVMTAIEAKAPRGGIVSEEQEAFLNDVRDAGGICGIARGIEDCDFILERWRNR